MKIVPRSKSKKRLQLELLVQMKVSLSPSLTLTLTFTFYLLPPSPYPLLFSPLQLLFISFSSLILTAVLEKVEKLAHPSGPFIAGSDLSWADLFLYPILADYKSVPEGILLLLLYFIILFYS